VIVEYGETVSCLSDPLFPFAFNRGSLNGGVVCRTLKPLQAASRLLLP
jgi:hypothetical protein